jgi:hypothetical protein
MDDSELRKLAQLAAGRQAPDQAAGPPSGARFADHIRRLQHQLGGRSPQGIEVGLAVPAFGRPYFAGTTSPVVTLTYSKIDSGLYVPAATAAGPSPHEAIKPYLTSDEVLPFDVGAGYALQWLSTVDRTSVLVSCAQILGRRDAIGADWAEITTDLARRWFQEPVATRMANLIAAGNVLLAPQAILVLAKLAIQASPPVGGSHDMSPLLTAFLSLQKDLNVLDEPDAPADTTDQSTRLYREVIRSQSFALDHDEATLMARHRLDWHELPSELASHPEFVDLPGSFLEATGVSLTDLEILGIALSVRAVESPGLPIPLSYFSTLDWAPERLVAALRLVTGTLSELAVQLDEHQREFGIQWSFDPLRRYPVILLESVGLLVLSPELLLERVFGWLPLFDLTEGLKTAGRGKLADRCRAFYARVCEHETITALSNIVTCAGFAPRLYGEDELRAAFGSDAKTADAVIDCGDTWVVVEISTRQLQRASVLAGNLEALETDLARGIDEKAGQIESTIRALDADESRLTGYAKVAGRKFIPVLVITEGFPVNPMTYRAIATRLREAGLLTMPRVAPLRILDQQEVYFIEHVVDRGQDGLLGLLEGYERGNLREMPFRNWLITERRLDAQRPSRLERPFTRAWAPALAALRRAERGGDVPDGTKLEEFEAEESSA